MIHPDDPHPSEWFESVYARSVNSGQDSERPPWSHCQTHPHFVTWLEQHPLQAEGHRALVVGCGLGDDAIELERRGFQVTAFDISPTAIQRCRERFPDSKVDFQVADLFAEQPQWHQAFDFVLEIFTVQALPPKYETELIEKIASFVAPAGQLLTIAMVAELAREAQSGPPWLLNPSHRDDFRQQGLEIVNRAEVQSEKRPCHIYLTAFQRQG